MEQRLLLGWRGNKRAQITCKHAARLIHAPRARRPERIRGVAYGLIAIANLPFDELVPAPHLETMPVARPVKP